MKSVSGELLYFPMSVVSVCRCDWYQLGYQLVSRLENNEPQNYFLQQLLTLLLRKYKLIAGLSILQRKDPPRSFISLTACSGKIETLSPAWHGTLFLYSVRTPHCLKMHFVNHGTNLQDKSCQGGGPDQYKCVEEDLCKTMLNSNQSNQCNRTNNLPNTKVQRVILLTF